MFAQSLAQILGHKTSMWHINMQLFFQTKLETLQLKKKGLVEQQIGIKAQDVIR